MTAYPNMTREERGAEYTRVRQEFELWKAKGLKLNLSLIHISGRESCR